MQATGELVAGRELDAVVAKKVLGWHRVPDIGDSAQWQDSTDAYKGRESDGDINWSTPLWSPSTNIAAAWQVVEHSDYHVQVRRVWVKSWDAWLWVAEFGLVSGEGETAPLAICRAALAAIGG